jgi:hypothetical protein
MLKEISDGGLADGPASVVNYSDWRWEGRVAVYLDFKLRDNTSIGFTGKVQGL